MSQANFTIPENIARNIDRVTHIETLDDTGEIIIAIPKGDGEELVEGIDKIPFYSLAKAGLTSYQINKIYQLYEALHLAIEDGDTRGETRGDTSSSGDT